MCNTQYRSKISRYNSYYNYTDRFSIFKMFSTEKLLIPLFQTKAGTTVKQHRVRRSQASVCSGVRPMIHLRGCKVKRVTPRRGSKVERVTPRRCSRMKRMNPSRCSRMKRVTHRRLIVAQLKQALLT